MLKNFSSENRERIYDAAKNNTKKNEKGLTVIDKDDPWRKYSAPKLELKREYNYS